ncbi:MAG: hypothetical protein A2023_04340 [Sulfuricurvum sp. GWF2_44_89]|uniref:Flagellar hook-length control protein-like C-terminal domain-containing protein n=1 Tax=Sulfuricurvum kujiense TaxID=148813 RepID=A0A2D3WMD5_9BACT|nr:MULTISPECIES: flagellar hook-length control protein FliK [Sulfuricurvum]OHD77013.1 MAG: hypothetical protein A2023_04340 [Sulfuricurvum sp. GWF2_44_89]OHD94976.1 MAG: hypothetical protein A2517_07410 [Sulfuricurvum sp. RIFOXYD12_FULL_44_77]OHD99265.1 MAG: hypothetical protein A2552_11395 [Sulfuricurvum sp. RIFOXYD2_FULL_44_160]DAB37713.1 MAG TPA: hypothetical protein CFH83_09770 [Sulfuricurvum kujiense]
MIHLSPEARLSIILPNTNKAFSEALKNATPEQLETLKEAKDIKSLLTSVFQDKTTASKSDHVLLDLLKNSTAFKTMGSFSDTLQSLVNDVKTSSELTSKTALLENFLKNVVTLDANTLKSQIASSGVFMESKFVAALQKLPDLIQNLEQLKTALSKMPQNEAKSIHAHISALLDTPNFSKASQNLDTATQLSEGIKRISESLQKLLSKSDPLYSNEVAILVQKLDQSSVIQELKTTLSQIYGSLLSSNAPDTNALLDSIEKLLKNMGNTPSEDLKAFTHQLQSAITQGDTSKELSSLLSKLNAFTNPKELVTETFLQESMANDVKSALLTLKGDLTLSNDPASSKLLEQTEKLLTQIDYHQLLSHLSSSNSIYFPFVWDQLQEGSLAFKKTADKKFYCEINLVLKEYGELDLMMGLYDENQLEIQAHTEKPELKALIHEHIADLRTMLIKSGLTPRSIRIFERNESKTPLNESYASSEGSDLGFEVKV